MEILFHCDVDLRCQLMLQDGPGRFKRNVARLQTTYCWIQTVSFVQLALRGGVHTNMNCHHERLLLPYMSHRQGLICMQVGASASTVSFRQLCMLCHADTCAGHLSYRCIAAMILCTNNKHSSTPSCATHCGCSKIPSKQVFTSKLLWWYQFTTWCCMNESRQS